MKKFLFFLLKILVIILAFACVLDVVYSNLFFYSKNRSKIGYIYNSKPQEFDVVILGSSRSNNHFVTQMFTDQGLKTFNFGMQGSKLFESDLVLKLLLEKKNKIKNVIIDVDVNLRSDKKSEAVILKFLPYLHDSEAIKKHLMIMPGYDFLYYIPFYRYVKYETKIGVREMFFCSINKKNKELDFGGYSALENSNTTLTENLNVNPIRNEYYEEIKSICKRNNINLIAIMTPMCENAIGMNYFEKVKKLYPEIHNYENVVVDNKYFSSCGHMNDTGARIFTTRILKDFFKK
ncbi:MULTISPECIES: hypothetical protein [unclassified Flavobacterium]|uniref:hypothetical protein n=1 Tax=unclassified Flavobacterium TaxID=196869 RepID=UPI000A3D7230|nr:MULTISPECIES: hypothetical protein [unclassified Flavobacterium]MEA9413091.1 hypothetical protein [Flavobacterium sp. PL02]OUL63036.1 hypothetical protein B8T70_07210 [Flavobacterium sp. AJR]